MTFEGGGLVGIGGMGWDGGGGGSGTVGIGSKGGTKRKEKKKIFSRLK